MATVERSTIEAFLIELGNQQHEPATLTLLGGCALCLLGSLRPTFDIDYVGDDLHKSAFQQLVEAVAEKLQLEIEAVPIEQFVPPLVDSDLRRHYVGHYGAIAVYILDPYTIALSKLDRGFDTDIADILFLVRAHLIELSPLEEMIQQVLPLASAYDLSPSAIRRHLGEVYRQLEAT